MIVNDADLQVQCMIQSPSVALSFVRDFALKFVRAAYRHARHLLGVAVIHHDRDDDLHSAPADRSIVVSAKQSPPSVEAPTWLFVIPWALNHHGGVVEVVKKLYRECTRDGRFQPLVMICDWTASQALLGTESGFRTVRLRLRRPPGTPFETLKWLLAIPRELWRLHSMLRDQRVAVVNFHYPSTAAINFTLLRQFRLYRGRLLLSFHLSDLRTAAATRGAARRVWQHVACHVDAASACSAALAAEVHRFLQSTCINLGVVYNGIDVNGIAEGSDLSIPSLPSGERRYLLNVATYEKKKGQDVLVRAFAALAIDFPDVDLVVIGRDGDEKARLAHLVQDLGQASRVHLLPAMNNRSVLTALRSAVAFVLPSRDEGFPVSLLEAGALSVPVVATRVGGVGELVVSDDLGLLVDANDVEQLATAIRRVLSDATLASAMGRALHARVSTEFTSRHSYEKLVSLI